MIAQWVTPWLTRMVAEPNPLWTRELRQGARIGRTPWILFAITLVVSLLMCSIGGIAAANEARPADIGSALFQVFFSLAYLVVVVVGPTVAANSVASEREGRTWEAVLLTGLTPKQIARGKFLAAYTTIGLYIVVLAPVGALSFLFGGVGATDVVLAFVYLFLLAGLGVAFGLAVSSLMASLRGAIVLTLMLAVVVGPLVYFAVGFGLSFAVHGMWSEVPEGFPVWLPLAYTRASFGIEYVLFLLVLPLVVILLPAWFLYELTVSNLSGDGEDQSTGLKRWFCVTTPVLGAALAVPCAVTPDDGGRMALAVTGIVAFLFYLGFAALLFAFEPAGPSRRVRIHWDRNNAGFATRFLGPGLGRTSLLVAAVGFGGLLALAFFDMSVFQLLVTAAPKKAKYTEQVFFFALYLAPFFVFFAGLTSWLRSRGNTPWITRIIALAVLFLAVAGPWVIAAIGGALSRHYGEDWLIIASPSPVYAGVMMASIDSSKSASMPVVEAGVVCGLVWGMVGLALLTAASRRSARTVAQQEEAMAATEAALRAEEEEREALPSCGTP